MKLHGDIKNKVIYLLLFSYLQNKFDSSMFSLIKLISLLQNNLYFYLIS